MWQSIFSRTHPERLLPLLLLQFIKWTILQMFGVIPAAFHEVTFVKPVQRAPVWLANSNSFANFP